LPRSGDAVRHEKHGRDKIQHTATSKKLIYGF
jgi:hypothetical protein